MFTSHWKSLPTETLVRTWAICWVVFNHAHSYGGPSTALTGGMTVLILLSGLSFARTALATADAEIVQSNLLRLCRILFVPSALIVLLSFAVKSDFRWTELAMVSNWIRPDAVARMPIWYVQTMIQIALGLLVVFSLPGALGPFKRHPKLASIGALVGATALHLASMQLYDTSNLYHRVPTLLLWNFVLGWCVYFLGFSHEATRTSKLVAVLCAISAGTLAWPIDEPNVYWLVLCTVLIVFVARVKMPPFAAWFVSVCSQALLAIFMLHLIFLAIYGAVFEVNVPLLGALFALSGSIFTWSVLVAAIGTYRALHPRAVQPSGN